MPLVRLSIDTAAAEGAGDDPPHSPPSPWSTISSEGGGITTDVPDPHEGPSSSKHVSVGLPPIKTSNQCDKKVLRRGSSSSLTSSFSNLLSEPPLSSFSLAATYHQRHKQKRRTSSVSLLDESEHRDEKTKTSRALRRRSLSDPWNVSRCSREGEIALPPLQVGGLRNPQSAESQDDYVEWNDLENVKFHCEGTLSLTFTAELNGMNCLVKLLKGDASLLDERAEDLFAKEIDLLYNNRHTKNVIRVLAKGMAENGQQFLVLECLAESLEERLKRVRQRRSSLSNLNPFKKVSKVDPKVLSNWKESKKARLVTVLQLARALELAHNKLKAGACVIHRDINPSNIGFRADGTCVLFDFGNAVVLEEYDGKSSNEVPREMTGNVGKQRYQSPEITLFNPYGADSDVWSFAIVAWEIMSLEVPWGNVNINEYLVAVVEGGQRLVCDDSWPKDFVAMMEECWHEDSWGRRPRPHEIVRRMEAIIADIDA